MCTSSSLPFRQGIRVSETLGNLSKVTQQMNSSAKIVLTPAFAFLRALSLASFWLVDDYGNYIPRRSICAGSEIPLWLLLFACNYCLMLLICSDKWFYFSQCANVERSWAKAVNSETQQTVVFMHVLFFRVKLECLVMDAQLTFKQSLMFSDNLLNIFIMATLKAFFLKSDVWTFLPVVSGACFF